MTKDKKTIVNFFDEVRNVVGNNPRAIEAQVNTIAPISFRDSSGKLRRDVNTLLKKYVNEVNRFYKSTEITEQDTLFT